MDDQPCNQPCEVDVPYDYPGLFGKSGYLLLTIKRFILELKRKCHLTSGNESESFSSKPHSSKSVKVLMDHLPTSHKP